MSTSSICELSQVLRGSLGIVDEYPGKHLTQSERREIAWLTEQCAQASDTWCRQHQSYKEGGVTHYPDFLNGLERGGHLRNIDERQGSRGRARQQVRAAGEIQLANGCRGVSICQQIS